jgi:hypothetical protein
MYLRKTYVKGLTNFVKVSIAKVQKNKEIMPLLK